MVEAKETTGDFWSKWEKFEEILLIFILSVRVKGQGNVRMQKQFFVV